jgi:aminoglycoside phosphotransferase (APT) family kinase protein
MITKSKIFQIFLLNKLEKPKLIKRIKIGFTNKVYLIDNKYILKVCEDESNEENFEKEVFFYKIFKNKIPVPKILIFDKSKKIYNKFYIIYLKIEGDNLYSKWHLMNDFERKNIIKQLCEILKIINKSSYKEFVRRFGLDTKVNWHDKVILKIEKHLKEIENKNLLSVKLINKIREFIKANHTVLNEQKIALVYWDAHFDNILVTDKKIVGILDFERTDLSSIDFTLDIIKRMVNYPKKYMSKEFEKYAKKEDYANLLIWFQEFYPELFEFKNLDKRLTFYSIEHDLDTLTWYPNSKEVKEMIEKTINLN